MTLGNELSASGLKRSGWTRFKTGVARRMGWLWKPRLYAGLLLGLLFGRALPGNMIAPFAPFGLAFAAAVRGAGGGPLAGLAVGLAVVVGAWGVMPAQGTLAMAAAVVFCHLACTLLRVGRRGTSPVLAACVAAVGAALVLGLAAERPPLTVLAFWVGMTGLLAMVFTIGIADTKAGRFLQSAEGESPLAAIVIMASALCGLDGLTIGGWISLRDVAAAVMVMTCAYAGGPALGAAAGGLLGIGVLFTALGQPLSAAGSVPVIAASLPQSRAVAFMVAGLLAGTFRELRKGGVGIAFVLGLITYAMVMVGQQQELLALSLSGVTGLLLFWVIPRHWLAGLPGLLAGPSGLAVLRHVPAPADPLVVVERMRGISHVLREVSRTFEQVAVVQEPVEQSPGRVFEQVTDRVCHACSLYRQCWEAEFHKTYQLYTDLWEQIDTEGPLPTQPIPEQLGQHCIKPDRVATTLNYLYDLERSRHHWESRLEEGRSVVQAYLKNINRMFDRFIEEVGAPDKRAWEERAAVIRAQAGIARLPRRGGLVSGDSYVGAALGQNRYLLALSDGMGVGRGAAIESKQCVKLLQEILEAGFSTEVAVNTVNSALLLRSPVECFATVDMALLDLATGRAEFVKVGAAPSFIKRGSEVTVVKVPSVPIGIINQVEIEPEFRVLQPGDVIVMLTDGIWDLSRDDSDKERWLIDHLVREAASDPEEIAESLLARARELSPDAADDMTVLVARIDRPDREDAPDEPKPQVTSTWAAAKVAPRFGDKPAGKRVK